MDVNAAEALVRVFKNGNLVFKTAVRFVFNTPCRSALHYKLKINNQADAL